MKLQDSASLFGLRHTIEKLNSNGKLLQTEIDNLVQIQAESDDEAYDALSVAIGYIPENGDAKLCGNRCRFHLEDPKYKDHCVLMKPDVTIPNVATCTEYVKGPPHEPRPPMGLITPEQVGAVTGKAQCKRCTRRGNIPGVCAIATSILRKVFKVKRDFKIDAGGCCNLNKVKGQKPIKSK